MYTASLWFINTDLKFQESSGRVHAKWNKGLGLGGGYGKEESRCVYVGRIPSLASPADTSLSRTQLPMLQDCPLHGEIAQTLRNFLHLELKLRNLLYDSCSPLASGVLSGIILCLQSLESTGLTISHCPPDSLSPAQSLGILFGGGCLSKAPKPSLANGKRSGARGLKPGHLFPRPFLHHVLEQLGTQEGHCSS